MFYVQYRIVAINRHVRFNTKITIRYDLAYNVNFIFYERFFMSYYEDNGEVSSLLENLHIM